MVEPYDILVGTGCSWSISHCKYLETQSRWLCGIWSNQICLVCLVKTARHYWECGHTLYDHFVQVFGFWVPHFKYKFTHSPSACVVSIRVCYRLMFYLPPWTLLYLWPTVGEFDVWFFLLWSRKALAWVHSRIWSILLSGWAHVCIKFCLFCQPCYHNEKRILSILFLDCALL